MKTPLLLFDQYEFGLSMAHTLISHKIYPI